MREGRERRKRGGRRGKEGEGGKRGREAKNPSQHVVGTYAAEDVVFLQSDTMATIFSQLVLCHYYSRAVFISLVNPQTSTMAG